MGGQPPGPQAKAAAFGLLLAIYIGGVYQAYRALAVERHPLPDSAHLQSPAGNATAPAADALCASPPALHCTLMPADPAGQLLNLPALAESHLQPALARLTGAPAARVTTSTLLHPPPLSAVRWNERRAAWVLPSAAAATWLHQLQRAAWTAAAGGLQGSEHAARVLLYVPPPERQPLLLELQPAPGGSRRDVGPAGGGAGAATHSSVELADGSLLLLVDTTPAGRDDGGGTSGEGGTALGPLAQRILAWLLHPLAPSSSSSGDAGAELYELQRALATACSAGARTALQQAAAVAAAAPGQPVTAAMSSRAAQAAQLLRQASLPGTKGSEAAGAAAALAAARAAWAAAHMVSTDPVTGARPAFPPEHSLAVLLPLGLPVALVLAQTAGRELSAWKQRRRGQASSGPAPEAAAAGAAAAGGPERSKAE